MSGGIPWGFDAQPWRTGGCPLGLGGGALRGGLLSNVRAGFLYRGVLLGRGERPGNARVNNNNRAPSQGRIIKARVCVNGRVGSNVPVGCYDRYAILDFTEGLLVVEYQSE